MNFRLARWPWLFALFLAYPSLASLPKDAGVLPPFTKTATLSKTKVNSAFTVTLNYTNDVAGNVVALKSSTANGTLMYYQWDALNRLAGVSGPNVGQTTYGYDGVGNLAGYTYPNGVANAFAYDSLNRLTNQVASRGTNVASYVYTLGAAGNRTAVTESNARVVNYTYDPLYRLTGETVASDPAGSNGAIGYTFDGVGNRLARSSTISAVPAASHSYTANDWLGSDSYDGNGNTIGSGGMADSYDFENRLVGHEKGKKGRFLLLITISPQVGQERITAARRLQVLSTFVRGGWRGQMRCDGVVVRGGSRWFAVRFPVRTNFKNPMLRFSQRWPGHHDGGRARPERHTPDE